MPAYVFYAINSESFGNEVVWGVTYRKTIEVARKYVTDIFEETHGTVSDIVEVYGISADLIKKAAKELEAEDDSDTGSEDQKHCCPSDWDNR